MLKHNRPFRSDRLRFHSLCFALATLSSTLIGCAAATPETAHTELRYMIAGIRVDPPAPGHNTVFVEFQDQTAQGGDFEDLVYREVISGVESRGYINTKDHSKADYVLWATLRIFTEAGTEAGDRALAGLGAIAGGVTGAAAVGAAGGSGTAQWAGALAGGGAAGVAVAMMTKKNAFQMVIDLQLARKVTGGVQTDSASGAQSGLRQATVTAGESGGSTMGQSKAQRVVETKVHFEMEQRVLAVADGTRLTQEIARAALIPKLISGLKSSLPRVR